MYCIFMLKAYGCTSRASNDDYLLSDSHEFYRTIVSQLDIAKTLIALVA